MSDNEMVNDRVAEGQRRINIIWEITQSIIAFSVVTTFLFVTSRKVLNSDMDTTAFIVLSNVVALVIGFYFGRTNHTKIGGVGPNEEGS